MAEPHEEHAYGENNQDAYLHIHDDEAVGEGLDASVREDDPGLAVTCPMAVFVPLHLGALLW